MRRSFNPVAAACAAIAVSACSHLPTVAGILPQATETATPDVEPRERVRTAIEFLGRGEQERAETELQAALEQQPGLSMAQHLLEQINSDPHVLLGGNARPYVVRQGETMSVLAERYLGDSLLFYALARYNNLDAPDQLVAGQTLMIPRRPGAASASGPARATAPIPPPASGTAPAAMHGADPARANQLRLQALQQMNGGQINGAVALLRQAQALDSGNVAIQRDLDRALRLQASLRAPAGGTN